MSQRADLLATRGCFTVLQELLQRDSAARHRIPYADLTLEFRGAGTDITDEGEGHAT